MRLGGFCIQAVVQPKRTKFPFYLFVSSCAKTKLNAKTVQSLRKQSFLPSLVLTVCAFANMELKNSWPVGKKVQQKKQWTLVLEVIPVFLADPWTPAPTAPVPGLPEVPVFLLKRLLKKLASTPSLAAPATEESEQNLPFSCDDNNASRILVGLPISCISLTQLQIDKTVLHSFQNPIMILI